MFNYSNVGGVIPKKKDPKTNFIQNAINSASSTQTQQQKYGIKPPSSPVNSSPYVPKPLSKPNTVSQPSATTTAPAPIVPAQKPPQSPARTEFMQNQLATPPAASTPTAPATTEPKKDSAYIAYLKTLYNPKDADINLKAKQDADKRLAETTNTYEKENESARRRYEQILDTPGGLKAGAEQAAALDRRRSNQELADISLQESAAARLATVATNTYNDSILAGSTLAEAQKAVEDEENKPLSLEDATTLGVQYGTTVAQARALGIIPTKDGIGVTGSNPAVDAYIKNIQNGTMKLTDVPTEYMSAVSQGIASQPKPRSEINQQAVNVIDELLANPKLDRIFGPADQFIGGLIGEAAVAKNKYNQLKGLLSLENIKYLKGTGAISDAEQRLLANAATALGRNLGNTEARQVLTQLKKDLEGVQTPTAQGAGAVIQTSAGAVNTDW